MQIKAKKPKKPTATTQVRVSWALWELVRREAKARDMSMRALGDAALRAYLRSGT
jgi:hypothetical protein